LYRVKQNAKKVKKQTKSPRPVCRPIIILLASLNALHNREMFKPIDDDQARTSTNDFTNLALLLRLLCILNSKTTSPTIMGALSKSPQAGVAKHNADISPLEGVTTILMQDHEVIATMYLSTCAVLAASESGLGASGGRPVEAGGAGADAGAGMDLDIEATCPSTADAGQFNMKFAAVPI
jgi:hypothetical protein